MTSHRQRFCRAARAGVRCSYHHPAPSGGMVPCNKRPRSSSSFIKSSNVGSQSAYRAAVHSSLVNFPAPTDVHFAIDCRIAADSAFPAYSSGTDMVLAPTSNNPSRPLSSPANAGAHTHKLPPAATPRGAARTPAAAPPATAERRCRARDRTQFSQRGPLMVFVGRLWPETRDDVKGRCFSCGTRMQRAPLPSSLLSSSDPLWPQTRPPPRTKPGHDPSQRVVVWVE